MYIARLDEVGPEVNTKNHKIPQISKESWDTTEKSAKTAKESTTNIKRKYLVRL